MTIEQINARLAEIRTLCDDPNADIDALTKEANELIAKRNQLNAAIEQRNALRDMVAGGAGHMIEGRSFPTAGQAAGAGQIPGVDSPEYRRAFLLNLANRGDQMTREERAAFTHTTTNTTQPLPTTMVNSIWDLVSTQHSILDDITIYRTGTIMEVVKHTAVAGGKAKSVAEGAANDDEQNTFIKVTLSGKDFAKHVEISYAMEAMSIDALEAYLVSEISAGIGAAMAADVVSTIESGMNAGNKVTTAAAGTVAYKEMANLFGLLARVGPVKVYATRKTIYTYLVGMVDSTGRPVFQPSAQEGQAGVILGASIREEDGVADGKILVGDPKKVLYNMIQDVLIETDRDVKNHKVVHSGYARGEGTLIDDKGFAELTVKTAS
jgi:HK97 family phage major capsid protein